MLHEGRFDDGACSFSIFYYYTSVECNIGTDDILLRDSFVKFFIE